MGFGLVPAGFACALASPSMRGAPGWLFGAATSLLGAARRVRTSERRRTADRLGTDEPGRRGDDSWREPRAVARSNRPLHVGAARSRRCRARPCDRNSGNADRISPAVGFQWCSGRPFPARTGRNWPPLPRRIRGQARSPAVLRVVSRSLWLRQRRIGRHHVGRRSQCCLLRPVARAIQLATGLRRMAASPRSP